MMLSISVITICFNNVADVKATCNSVDGQSRLPQEHLIIDGSTGKDILEWLSNNPQPSYRKWIHERDKGISDAFNKGINNAKGDITHLLNSGDSYIDKDALSIVMEMFEKDSSLAWVHSKYVQNRGNIDIISGVPFDPNQLWKGMRTVAHPSMFIKKDVYKKHGGYDETYKIAMDYDLLIRIRNEKNLYIDRPLVYFAPGGASDLQFKRGLDEVKKSYQKYLGKSWKQSIWQKRQKLLNWFMSTGIGKVWFRVKNSNKRHQKVTSS